MKFKNKSAAEKAIKEANGTEWMEKTLSVDWAFLSGPVTNVQ